MPQLGERIRGDILLTMKGRSNDYYVWHHCPECLKERWILDWKTKLENFTGLCQICNARKNNNRKEAIGDKHPRWNNGVMMTNGYASVLIPNHPEANVKGYVRRSHLVLEETMGRPLSSDCVAHHLNGIKDDDRPNNLIEIHKVKHQTLHAIQRKIAKEARRKVVEWGDEECIEHPTCETTVLLRRECDKCWQAQTKIWGI